MKDIKELWEKCGGYWKSHPDYPIEDWIFEVHEGNTRRGYWDWVWYMLSTKDEEE